MRRDRYDFPSCATVTADFNICCPFGFGRIMDRFYIVLLITLATSGLPSWSKPILVKFGTNTGPIVPPPSTTQPPVDPNRSPAPVSERSDDIPNPSTYRPLVPSQYRSKLYSYKPKPDLILGTPLDRKYSSLGYDKYNLYKKQYAKSAELGKEYRGPQLFDKQQYEYDREQEEAKKRPQGRQAYQVVPVIVYRSGRNSVPQIGILYSSGIRYYVPLVPFYSNNAGRAEDENSVYDNNDYYNYQYRDDLSKRNY